MLGRLKRQQAGDTIIEVMVVLAVLGSAIGIAYSTANRSLLNARQAQESSRATVIAQAQIEQLRALSSVTDHTNPNYIYISPLPFCMDGSGHVVPFIAPSTYPLTCQYDKTPDFEYDVKIVYSNVLGDDKFTVTVLYDDVLGQGRDSVTLIYRAHTP